MSIEILLRETVKAGGRELRLAPGRKLVIIAAEGEREVQGPEQTPATIQQLIAPLMNPAARQSLVSGWADWVVQHRELGPVRIVLDIRNGGPLATLTIQDQVAQGVAVASVTSPAPSLSSQPAETLVTVPPPPRAETPAPRNGNTAEMEGLFVQMFEMKASDLHMSVGSAPLVRHDGEIKELSGRTKLSAADTERILLSIAPDRNREEFSRRNDTDFAYDIPGVSRFRCNLFRDRKGVGGVFRVIPSKIITAEDMGLSPEILQLCFLSKGLVLVTGPTGSGKSTTLCALIDYINRHRMDHIITIEDPIEFVHENKKCLINQRQVGEHTDSFKDALRAALREDPDIVLVGEMRDLETVSIAIETAETGHLVFGTLHTSSAASTVDRIIDQFPADRQDQIRVMLASSLKGVISQMLCKKIGGGRVPALEVMIGIPSIANLIRESKIFQIPSIIQTGKKIGMRLMNDSLVDLVQRKIVEPEEAYAKAVDKTGLLSMFKQRGVNTSWAPAEGGIAT
ncbi:MAG TPA: type IV pilus twitching motility protein PilT [Thermoanaerobaculia bacterium]|nr:type IV pilus twitching motility protein PilT [Thermoanaerobaculia bacterium]